MRKFVKSLTASFACASKKITGLFTKQKPVEPPKPKRRRIREPTDIDSISLSPGLTD